LFLQFDGSSIFFIQFILFETIEMWGFSHWFPFNIRKWNTTSTFVWSSQLFHEFHGLSLCSMAIHEPKLETIGGTYHI
jgi:hypothetical protein